MTPVDSTATGNVRWLRGLRGEGPKKRRARMERALRGNQVRFCPDLAKTSRNPNLLQLRCRPHPVCTGGNSAPEPPKEPGCLPSERNACRFHRNLHAVPAQPEQSADPVWNRVAVFLFSPPLQRCPICCGRAGTGPDFRNLRNLRERNIPGRGRIVPISAGFNHEVLACTSAQPETDCAARPGAQGSGKKHPAGLETAGAGQGGWFYAPGGVRTGTVSGAKPTENRLKSKQKRPYHYNTDV